MTSPRMGLRGVAILAVTGAALTGAAWGGYALLTNGAATPVAPAIEEKPKTTHPPIAMLRETMLHEFHGSATNVFTSIQGFGWERMRPMYKKIPFEIPYFSTAELEIDPGPKEIPIIIKPFLDKSLTAFNDPAPIKSVVVQDPELQFGPRLGGLGVSFRGAIAHGMQLRMLDLVGLVDKDEPKVYSGGQAFELVRMNHEDRRKAEAEALKRIAADPLKVNEMNPLPGFGLQEDLSDPAQATPHMPTRSLDSFEIAGAAALAEGKDVFIRSKDHVVRMLGALRASDQCLKCHTEAKKGDLLGAFSYTFVDTAKVKRSELEK